MRHPTRCSFRAVRTMATAEKTVLVPIGTGSEEMEAIITVDVLRRAGAKVTVASVEDSLEVTCSRGVKIVADKLMKDAAADSYDLIACPVSCGVTSTVAPATAASWTGAGGLVCIQLAYKHDMPSSSWHGIILHWNRKDPQERLSCTS